MAEEAKRPLKRSYIPDGNTPGKSTPKSRIPVARPSGARKSLFTQISVENPNQTNQQTAQRCSWTDDEIKGLVQYICLYWPHAWNNKWPVTGNMTFWNACAEAINVACNSNRTGTSCRSRVTKHLVKQYSTLSDAEEALKIDYIFDPNETIKVDNASTPNTREHFVSHLESLSPIFNCSPFTKTKSSIGDTVLNFIQAFKHSMSGRLKKQLLKHLFKLMVIDTWGNEFYSFVQDDFLEISLNAMYTLHCAEKFNLLHSLSKCFIKRTDDSLPRMPLDRMPFGLLDYNIRFFATDAIQNVHAEKHYTTWVETMFAHFGHKWLCLFRGPAWQYETEPVEVDTEIPQGHSNTNLLESAMLECGILEVLNEAEVPVVANATVESNEEASSSTAVEPYQSVSIPISQECNSKSQDHQKNASHLWTHLSPNDVSSITDFGVSFELMEQHHKIVPVTKFRKKKNSGLYDPMKSKTNVACIGVRQIQKNIVSSGFLKSVDIQAEALEMAKRSNPQGRWWIKADACDVRKGLRESMAGKWSGDEDLGDNTLQTLFEEYTSRCKFVKALKLGGKEDCERLCSAFNQDSEFLESGEKEARKAYEEAMSRSNISNNSLMELSWAHVGFEELQKKVQKCQRTLTFITTCILLGDTTSVKKILNDFKNDVCHYLKDLYVKKRTAAGHLLAFMLSDERRSSKPYAIPVRFLPYQSISDEKLRALEIEIEDKMKFINMVPVGFTTDGEFNSLRTMGRVRPISIVELIKTARNSARTMKFTVMKKYFQLSVQGDAKQMHPAIPVEDVVWLNNLIMQNKQQPLPFHDALLLLRKRLLPFTNKPHPWIQERKETTSEVMKSIMAIYLFRLEVERLSKLDVDPANFDDFLYQPELDAQTAEFVHQREDHNHLLKRIIVSLREGNIPGIDLRFMRDALHDPSTGLTYEALTGKNKQSVPDCERIISVGVISFMEKNRHESEKNILTIIRNWHRAVDGRGISQDTRVAFLQEMKKWILDDWMPWYSCTKKYSTIDVNRPIKGVCGLSRETVIGLVANIESRLIRHEEYIAKGIPPEHPRSSSTDDVEGLMALLHEVFGPVFDLKQFYDECPKILNEFKKRIDPELPFFYWTGAKQRYTEFELPSFNEPTAHGIVERLDKVKISRRGDPGVFVANRASLPQKGQLTVRAQFHKAPIALPPSKH